MLNTFRQLLTATIGSPRHNETYALATSAAALRFTARVGEIGFDGE